MKGFRPWENGARQGVVAAALARLPPHPVHARSAADRHHRQPYSPGARGAQGVRLHPGPVFTNLLLADEINRASPKTQAALLEAMQERRVTTFGETRPLPAPFFVLATQNPIELEGTYPLPEAQLDRFMFKVDIAGVERSVLEEILVTRVHGEPPPLEPVLTPTDLDDLFALVDAVHLPRGVANYIARLVAASHPASGAHLEAAWTFVKVRQLAARRDRDWRRIARACVASRQAERRLRRRAPRRRACDRASAGARLRGTAGRMGQPPRRRRAARGDPRDRKRSAADAGSEVNVETGDRWGLSVGWALSSSSSASSQRSPPTARLPGRSVTESLKITIDSEWGVRTAPGYLPVRFDITNLGEPRVIEIVGQGTRFFRTSRGGQPGGTRVRQAVRLARGDRVRMTIPVPIFADNESIRFEIREDDRVLERLNVTGQSGSRPVDAAALSWRSGDPVWICSVRVAETGHGTAAPVFLRIGEIAERHQGEDPGRFHPRTCAASSQLARHTSLRAVLIGPKEWAQLNDDQRSALLAWTACGGDLMFVDGDLSALLRAGTLSRALEQTRPCVDTSSVAFTCSTSASITAAGLADTLSAAEKVQDPNWALPANRAMDWGIIGPRGFRLPIPGVDGVPARAYLSILVFSLLIGPVNYWLLWRKRQQVLLVLTAPVISAIFILLLAGYVVAGEGLGVRGRAVTFTMLDQVRKQASTRATMSLYAAGATPSSGLRFARDTAVFPVGTAGTGTREQIALDLTDTRTTRRGRPRRALQPISRKSHSGRRERLSFSREAGGISVVNELGATITTLVYRDGDTVYRLDGSLAPGARANWKTEALMPSPWCPWHSADVAIHPPCRKPAARLVSAVLEQSPFWEPGVSGVAERGSFHLVIGWPEGQP